VLLYGTHTDPDLDPTYFFNVLGHDIFLKCFDKVRASTVIIFDDEAL
jgi:hypothetical protein